MPRVVLDITTSLDGFVTGPDPGPGAGLGVGGEALHDWALGGRTAADAELMDRSFARTGAVVMGRRTFDIVDAPGVWSDEMGFGADLRGRPHPPVVVLTHTEPAHVRMAERFHIETGGLEAAIARARGLAGDRDVTVMGGAETVRACLAAGIGDELTLHIAPLLLGAGTPLFGADVRGALTPEAVVSTPGATHVTYAIG